MSLELDSAADTSALSTADTSLEDYNFTGSTEKEKYRKKYHLLVERCEILEQDDQQLAARLQKLKKIIYRGQIERRFLEERLDSHGDDWRNGHLSVCLEDRIGKNSAAHFNVFESRKPKIEQLYAENTTSPTAINPSKSASARKKKHSGTQNKPGSSLETNPGWPLLKRPSNPFLQFCLEQRRSGSIGKKEKTRRVSGEKKVNKGDVADQTVGPVEPNATQILASRWNSLPELERKIYYDRYREQKEKYDEQINALKAADGSGELSSNKGVESESRKSALNDWV